MNDKLDNLADKIYAPRHSGQLPAIRKLFDMYLREIDSDDGEDSPAVIYLAVGFIFAIIVLFGLFTSGAIKIL